MKKNFVKRVLATVLSTTMIVGSLTACGSGSDAASTDNSTSGESTTAENSEAQQTTSTGEG